MSSGNKIAKVPPFYNVNNDTFYHGPAWVIKPELFPRKETHVKHPGPAYYRIPNRSVYAHPGVTIASRYETSPPSSTHLLAYYHPTDQYISSTQMPAISITPRRTKHEQSRNYAGCFYTPTNMLDHCRASLLRPSYRPSTARKSLNHHSSSSSPGPATYPIYDDDEDILPRPQPGFTQKHRFSSGKNQKIFQTNPPFYYPNKTDQHRLPSFTIGKRLLTFESTRQHTAPYYSSIHDKAPCLSTVKPGITLKGRWSPAVCVLTEG
ncbi:unnamed protein product [Adineta ricciae]|uniref:Uncharacterized protein n=1 Tax=Adineta ricciae TaxID=249248 RepID=A0A814FFU1_ADIRI|nr:unnamed protein product [Adineta ricciae]